jgi:hypothetical protein
MAICMNAPVRRGALLTGSGPASDIMAIEAMLEDFAHDENLYRKLPLRHGAL